MILVVGATGTLGGLITRGLLAKGHKVRILVRPQSQFQPLKSAGAEVVYGDLKDPASLAGAMQGAERVVTTANSALRGMPDTVATVDLAGNRALIDAAKAARVKQFVFISGLGRDEKSPSPFMQAKAATEKHLQQSGVPYTVFVPNFFMEVWVGMVVGGAAAAGKPVTIIGSGTRQHSMISVGDVAAFAVAALGNPAALNQVFFLGGPAPITWHDVLASYEKAIGKKLELVKLPVGGKIPGVPDLMSELMGALDTFDSPIPMEQTAKTFGVPMTSLDTFVRQSMRA